MTFDPRLLQAAFGARDRAAVAWDGWSRERDLAALDAVEMRLLPAVYRNLREAGVAEEAIAAVVKQMTRSMWIRTRLLLHQAAETVAFLSARGIEPLLLKGAALVAGGYCDARVRPMADFDLLVAPSEALRVAALLDEAGWRTEPALDRRVLTFRHAALFRKGDVGCDLHWWAFWETRDTMADEQFRVGAERVMLDGVAVRVPRPEHQLLHVVTHGTQAFDPGSVRWVGDALAILHARPLDWPLLIDVVESLGLSYPMGEALAYLTESFQAPVPDDAIAALRLHRVSRWQRRLYAPRPDAQSNPHTARLSDFVRSLAVVATHQKKGRPFSRFLWFARNLRYALGSGGKGPIREAMKNRFSRR